MNNKRWTKALELDYERKIVEGSEEALGKAIMNGADLRIQTAFRHNEHIETGSANDELVSEVSEFRATYMLDLRFVAGFMTLRQPVDIPIGFGARSSLSLFLYNQNAQQGIARPFLDQWTGDIGVRGAFPLKDHSQMPKYEELDNWDENTNAPSSNFIYSFEHYRYWVNEEWQEVLSHSAEGDVVSGSLQALVDAFHAGAEVKVGIKGLCNDLSSEQHPIDHEVFIQVGFTYYYRESKLFLGETHPVVRVAPNIPLQYESGNWDYAWLMPRTDGFVAMRIYDPYTQQFRDKENRYAIRWFVR